MPLSNWIPVHTIVNSNGREEKSYTRILKQLDSTELNYKKEFSKLARKFGQKCGELKREAFFTKLRYNEESALALKQISNLKEIIKQLTAEKKLLQNKLDELISRKETLETLTALKDAEEEPKSLRPHHCAIS